MNALPRSEILCLSGPAGDLEARLEWPAQAPTFGVVLGHPHPLHGGTMQTNMVVHAGRSLLTEGGVVLRFNFRGVGRSGGHHHGHGGEAEDFQAALEDLCGRFPDLPLLAAGCSFGALRAMECSQHEQVHGCLAIVPPVTHPNNQPPPVAQGPSAVVLAEQDELVPRPSEELLGRLYPDLRRLEVVAGADHLFRDVLPAYREAVRVCAEVLLRES